MDFELQNSASVIKNHSHKSDKLLIDLEYESCTEYM